jgi:hypothetical protein
MKVLTRGVSNICFTCIMFVMCHVYLVNVPSGTASRRTKPVVKFGNRFFFPPHEMRSLKQSKNNWWRKAEVVINMNFLWYTQIHYKRFTQAIFFQNAQILIHSAIWSCTDGIVRIAWEDEICLSLKPLVILAEFNIYLLSHNQTVNSMQFTASKSILMSPTKWRLLQKHFYNELLHVFAPPVHFPSPFQPLWINHS